MPSGLYQNPAAALVAGGAVPGISAAIADIIRAREGMLARKDRQAERQAALQEREAARAAEQDRWSQEFALKKAETEAHRNMITAKEAKQKELEARLRNASLNMADANPEVATELGYAAPAEKVMAVPRAAFSAAGPVGQAIVGAFPADAPVVDRAAVGPEAHSALTAAIMARQKLDAAGAKAGDKADEGDRKAILAIMKMVPNYVERKGEPIMESDGVTQQRDNAGRPLFKTVRTPKARNAWLREVADRASAAGLDTKNIQQQVLENLGGEDSMPWDESPGSEGGERDPAGVAERTPEGAEYAPPVSAPGAPGKPALLDVIKGGVGATVGAMQNAMQAPPDWIANDPAAVQAFNALPPEDRVSFWRVPKHNRATAVADLKGAK